MGVALEHNGAPCRVTDDIESHYLAMLVFFPLGVLKQTSDFYQTFDNIMRLACNKQRGLSM